MLLYEYTNFQEVDRRDTRTSDTDPALVPCAVLLLLPLLHTPASASSAVMLLIRMLPLLRVQHHQPCGYRHFFSLKTLLGVRHIVIWQALLGYVIYEYYSSMGLSHADRVLVIGDAGCEPSTIQPKRKRALLSVMLQHAAVRVLVRRLIDEAHAERH